MKKRILLAGLLLSGVMTATTSYSQEEVKIFAGDPQVDGTVGVIYGVSDNGKYVVGSDDALGSGGYYFDMETETFNYFGDIETGGNYFAYDVSDNGIIVGACIHPDAKNENGEAVEAIAPAYYKDGEWHPLPVKAYMAGGIDVNGVAKAISPDGRIIAGYIKRSAKEAFEPVLWIDGELTTYADLKIYGVGTIVNSMSADGKILGGFAEWESGARSAAIWKEGVETRLSTLEDPVESGGEWVDSEGWMSISPNGKYMAGYCAESSSGVGLKALYGEVEKGVEGLQENEGAIFACVDDEGTCYGTTGATGSAMVMRNGKLETFEDSYGVTSDKSFQVIMAASKTGKVVGGAILVSAFGSAINAPFVAIAGEEQIGINDTEEANAEAELAGDLLYLSGDYTRADIYNMGGNMVKTTSSPITDLSSLPAGVYAVRIVAGNGTKTVKIAK